MGPSGPIDGGPAPTTIRGSSVSSGKKEIAKREVECGLSRVKDP